MSSTDRRRYTIEELNYLKDSPLVENKPELKTLIEGWMSTSTDNNQRNNNRTNARTEESSTVGSNSNQQRPSFFQTRHLSRGSSTVPEDIILGPPKPSFSSNARRGDGGQKSPLAYRDNDTPSNEKLNIRDKFFRDRENERQRDRNGVTNGRRNAKEEGDSWNNRKSTEEDPENWHRGGDRDKNRFSRELRENGAEDEGEGTKRRNGAGRGKFDWPAKDADNPRTTQQKPSWRDREPRDRKDDREWVRGGRNGDRAADRGEAEQPEWMDAGPAESKAPRTQEDFQRWKEQMKANSSKTETKKEEPPPSQPVEAKPATKASKPATPLALESGLDRLFGGAWADVKKTEPPTPDTAQPVNVQRAKMKASKFAGFFAPRDEPISQVATQQIPEATQSPPPRTSEDQEGFKNILAMLNATKIASPSPQPTGNMGPPPKPKVEQQSAAFPEEQIRAPEPEFRMPGRRGTVTRTPVEEQRNPFEGHMMPQNPNDRRAMQALFASLPPVSPMDQMRRSPPKRTPDSEMLPPNDINREMHSRSTAQRGSRALDRNGEFLLNLMQQRTTPAQQVQPHRPPPPQQANYNIFLDEEPKAPKPQKLPSKGLPPGLFNESYLYDPEPPRPELTRKTSQRAPPGLYDDPAIASLQRRNTAENIARHQLTNMGIPQHPGPEQFLLRNAAGALQHQDRIAPPPGFAGPTPTRQPGPPGFGGPPGMPLNSQQPHLPPMQRGMPGGPPGMFQGGMQGPPPGFFREQQVGPLGYGPGAPPLGHESMLGLEQMNPHPGQMPRHFDPYGGMPPGRVPGGRGYGL